MLRVVFKNPWVQAVVLVFALLMLGLFLHLLRPVLISLLLAFLVAYILHPLVTGLERWRIPRTVTVVVLGVLGLVLLAAIPFWLVPTAITEAEAFVQGGQGNSQSGRWFEWFEERLPLENWMHAAGWVPDDAEDVNVREVLVVRIDTILRKITDRIGDFFHEQIWSLAATLASLGWMVVRVVFFIGNVAIFAFVAAYLLRDFDHIQEDAKMLVPLPWRPKVFDIAHKIDHQLKSFLRGEVVVATGLGIMYTFGLVMSGAPFAIILGVSGGIFSLIPYLGFVLTFGPAVFLTLLQYGLSWHVAGVVATFLIAQTIESVWLTPWAVGKRVGLNPVWVILAIMVFGTAFGFLGFLIAAPIAAALKVFVMEALQYYRRSDFYRAGASSSSEDSG